MKLLIGNGRTLEARDVSDVLFRVRANSVPIKFHGSRIMPDDEARETLKEILATGCYDYEKCIDQPESEEH